MGQRPTSTRAVTTIEAAADAEEPGQDAGRQAQAEEEQNGHDVGLRVEGCPQVCRSRVARATGPPMKRVRELKVERPGGVAAGAAPQSGAGWRERARPAVVLLHGAGGTAQLALGNTGWTELADREGILLAYPEGTRRDPASPPMFLQNPQAWNDGSGRGHTARTGVDDVAFHRGPRGGRWSDAMGADPARIYLAGFSNGASMAFRAGAALAGRVAAIGPVAGHCWVSPPASAQPVPALMIFGGLDPLNPPEGGEVKTPWGSTEYHPPVLESFDRWRAFNGCAGEPAVRPRPSRACGSSAPPDAPPAARCAAWSSTISAITGPADPGSCPPWIAGPASARLDGARVLWEFFRAHRLT